MTRRSARTRGGRRGAAATELALLLPFLLFLFFVAVDYCRAYHAAQVIGGCAHSAALYGSGAAARHPGTGTAEQAAVWAAVAEGARVSPAVRPEDVSVVTANGAVTATVTYRFPTVTRYTGASGGFTIVRAVTLPVVPRPGN